MGGGGGGGVVETSREASSRPKGCLLLPVDFELLWGRYHCDDAGARALTEVRQVSGCNGIEADTTESFACTLAHVWTGSTNERESPGISPRWMLDVEELGVTRRQRKSQQEDAKIPQKAQKQLWGELDIREFET